MLVELVTDPLAPSVPWVLTVIRPEEKTVAGPVPALLMGTVAVWGLFEASADSVTRGVLAAGLQGWPKAVTTH